MGTPIETDPVSPDECLGYWYTGCPGGYPISTPAECEALCGGATGATCPPYTTRDRGVGINPRYCVYALVGGYWTWTSPNYCYCFGVYLFDHCE